MTEQLRLEVEPPRPNPNAHLFDADGKPRRLLWCSDSARMGGPCPYVGEKAKYRPAGGCCLDLVGLSQEEIDERVIDERHAEAVGR